MGLGLGAKQEHLSYAAMGRESRETPVVCAESRMVQCFVFLGNKGQLHVPTPALVAEPT